jgi:hypothetical protein
VITVVPRLPVAALNLLRLGMSDRLVVRGRDAELQLDPADPLECSLGDRSLGVEQIPDHSERA